MTGSDRLRAECRFLGELLAVKNADYGNAAAGSPILLPGMSPRDALLVRMSDKISRIAALSQGGSAQCEPLLDSVRDLAGYCVLWLVAYDDERLASEC